MDRKAAMPDFCTPILIVVVVMSVLFGLVQRIARHIDHERAVTSQQALNH